MIIENFKKMCVDIIKNLVDSPLRTDNAQLKLYSAYALWESKYIQGIVIDFIKSSIDIYHIEEELAQEFEQFDMLNELKKYKNIYKPEPDFSSFDEFIINLKADAVIKYLELYLFDLIRNEKNKIDEDLYDYYHVKIIPTFDDDVLF